MGLRGRRAAAGVLDSSLRPQVSSLFPVGAGGTGLEGLAGDLDSAPHKVECPFVTNLFGTGQQRFFLWQVKDYALQEL